MILKKCSKCKIEYPLTQEYFHKSKKEKSGFKCDCKKCRNKESKERYSEVSKDESYNKKVYQARKENGYLEKNKEKLKDDNKEYYKKNKEKRNKYMQDYYDKNYSKGCWKKN
jgi:hypothetical protein